MAVVRRLLSCPSTAHTHAVLEVARALLPHYSVDGCKLSMFRKYGGVNKPSPVAHEFGVYTVHICIPSLPVHTNLCGLCVCSAQRTESQL